jgi:hypothetical protein
LDNPENISASGCQQSHMSLRTSPHETTPRRLLAIIEPSRLGLPV